MDAHTGPADDDLRPGSAGGPGTRDGGPVAARQHPVPAAVRALSTLSPPDYADAFTLTAPAGGAWSPSRWPAEQWARALFGDVPSVAERVIWQGLLGLRLARGRSPGQVAGWAIAGRGDGWLRLEAASWFVTAQLVVHTDERRLTLATFMRYDRRLAAWVWTPLSAVHRRLAPGLLLGAQQALPA